MVKSLIDPKKREEIKKALDRGDFTALGKIGQRRKPPAEGIAPPREDGKGVGGEEEKKKTPKKDIGLDAELLKTAQVADLRGMEAALDGGADVNAKDRNGMTALIIATTRGSVNAVELLINRGADVNMEDNKGDTALACATVMSHGTIAKLLREHGARNR